LCRRHPRGESEGIFEWVLPMGDVKKLPLGILWRKFAKLEKKLGAISR
jgi:hypothetical protein